MGWSVALNRVALMPRAAAGGICSGSDFNPLSIVDESIVLRAVAAGGGHPERAGGPKCLSCLMM